MSKRSGFRNNSGKEALRRETTIAVENHRDIKNKRKSDERSRRNWFSSNIEVDCQLYRANGKYPQTRSMCLKEMALLNKKYIIDYGSAIDKNPDAMLWKWKMIDFNKYAKMRDAYVYETT